MCLSRAPSLRSHVILLKYFSNSDVLLFFYFLYRETDNRTNDRPWKRQHEEQSTENDHICSITDTLNCTSLSLQVSAFTHGLQNEYLTVEGVTINRRQHLPETCCCCSIAAL